MTLYSLHANLEWKLGHKKKFGLGYLKQRRAHLVISHFKKDQKCGRKMNFDLSKFKFQNGLKKKKMGILMTQ